MTNKSISFYFKFYFYFDGKYNNNYTQDTKGFLVENIDYTKSKYKNFEEFYEALYDDYTQDIESDYGVHDVSGNADFLVDGISYTSYEVEEDRVSALMEAWREVFIKAFPGSKVSQPYDW